MAKFTVDFSKTEDTPFESVAPGRYIAKVEEITKEDGVKAPYLKWKLKIVSAGGSKGLFINHITTLSPNALFGLRDTLEALGVKVPKAAVAIDPDKFVGKELGIEVFMKKDDKDDTKEYANIKKVFNKADLAKAKAETEALEKAAADVFGGDVDDEVVISLDD